MAAFRQISKLLYSWAEAVGVNPHPSANFFRYTDVGQLQSDFSRIGKWFAVSRMPPPPPAKKQKPEEAEAQPVNTDATNSTPLPLLTSEKAVEVGKTTDGAMGHSLMTWGKIEERWRNMGLKLPTATTTAESGFYAHRVLIFDVATKILGEDTFSRYAQLTCLFLNYNLLHGWDMPDPRSGDKRVLALLDAAYEWLAIVSGLHAVPAMQVRQKFEATIRAHRASSQTTTHEANDELHNDEPDVLQGQ